jgi:hypothetical protein
MYLTTNRLPYDEAFLPPSNTQEDRLHSPEKCLHEEENRSITTTVSMQGFRPSQSTHMTEEIDNNLQISENTLICHGQDQNIYVSTSHQNQAKGRLQETTEQHLKYHATEDLFCSNTQ